MVICFLGDSLTQGIGDALALGWVGRLAQASFVVDETRATALTVCNLGLRGDSSLRVAARWREEADRRRRPGEDMAFVFSFGAADRPQQVARAAALEATRGMLDEAKALGRTLFITPPPAHNADWAALNRELGLGLLDLCAQLGVPAFDLYPPLAASTAYLASLAAGDGIHPDAAGYDEMAAHLRGWQPLRELMGI